MTHKEELQKKLRDLMNESCDCVRSIRAATICWRCREIVFLQQQIKNVEDYINKPKRPVV